MSYSEAKSIMNKIQAAHTELNLHYANRDVRNMNLDQTFRILRKRAYIAGLMSGLQSVLDGAINQMIDPGHWEEAHIEKCEKIMDGAKNT